VVPALFIASAKCNGILCLSLSLSPRNRAHALAAAHSASSITTLERQRESLRRAAGRLEDAASNALPVGNDDGDDVHRVGQRRSWPTNGTAERVGDERVTTSERRRRRRRSGGGGAVLRLVPGAPYVGAVRGTVSRGSAALPALSPSRSSFRSARRDAPPSSVFTARARRDDLSA